MREQPTSVENVEDEEGPSNEEVAAEEPLVADESANLDIPSGYFTSTNAMATSYFLTKVCFCTEYGGLVIRPKECRLTKFETDAMRAVHWVRSCAYSCAY